MAATINDTTSNPVVTASGTTVTPFSGITANEASPLMPALEVVSIQLSAGANYSGGDLGSISDPGGPGVFNSSNGTFAESVFSFGSPSGASNILGRLVYTPPRLANGTYATVDAAINVGSLQLPPIPGNNAVNVADPNNPVVLQTVTPPGISGTGAEQVASGTAIRPFAATRITDNSPGYGAQTSGTITLTDATGAASDAGGTLAGPGLTKTGVGTYALAAGSYYALQSNLNALTFTPAAVAAGSTATTGFDLSVTDAATKLTADDKGASVQVSGTSATPVAPFIAGTSGQTVAAGNGISPFNGVVVSDSNAKPLDSATLTLSGGGTLSGAGLAAAGAGVYTLAAASPAALSASLQKLTFTAAPLSGQGSATTTIKLDVADAGQVASDSQTAVTTVASLPGSAGQANFTITDQTTGQQTFIGGDQYSGPVQGISQELNLVTSDNLNITATMPNVFIRTGSGDDAIDVSKVNGNNVLDGGSGSSFLTGGTGNDTFFLDDRNLTSDAYSTVVNFHGGDNITVFGVDATNFHLATQDNQGAAGAKGLAFTFAGAGKPNATVVIAGFSSADLANGRLTTSYGSNPATPGVAGSGGPYFNIHGN